MRLDALDEAAEALDLELGLPLNAARARVPNLTVVEADPDADRDFLAAIGEVCRRYSPALALDPPDGVHLDITGAGPFFGGERRLIADLSARLQRQGITVRIGAAHTLGLAWALSRYRDRRTVGSVRDLPVAALRIDAQSVGVLNRLGLRRIGQILDIPRPALARRLDGPLLERLDEALGFRAAALDLVAEPLVFHAQHKLLEPIGLETQILSLCRWLAQRLSERLERRNVGGRVFALDLFRVDGACKRLVVQAGRPLRDPARITGLFTERLAVLNEGLEADFGFDFLRLTAERVEPMSLKTGDFMGCADDGDFTALIDRLSARLGQGAIHRLAPEPQSLIPEQAVKSENFSAIKALSAWATESPAVYNGIVLRPLTLFAPPQPIEVIAGVPEDPPKQFNWRRMSHAVVRAEGPERIAWEWWRGMELENAEARSEAKPPSRDAEAGLMGDPQPAADRTFRDYYRVEDDKGRRFWVFREGAFVTGSRPRWFLHGLFA